MKKRNDLYENEVKYVGIYARVSTEEQAEQGYSIEAQITTLRNLCKAEQKIVFKEYVDAGISGKTIEKRPAIKQLLRDVEEGKIQEVLVWKLDRISRKMSDLLQIVEHLNRNNVKFRSYSEKDFDTETASGKLNIQMLGVIAEFQRNTIVENVKMGMKQRARKGKWNGGTVLGYDVVEVESGCGKDSVLKINHIEAELVQKIFRMYGSGQGLRSIANQLNAESYVIERIAMVVQTPKLLDDIVMSLNKSRSKSVAPLQKELAAIERELKTLDSQKQRYFALYESDTIDNDILVERINELKSKYDLLANRKSEAERQLDENQGRTHSTSACTQGAQRLQRASADLSGRNTEDPNSNHSEADSRTARPKLRGIELEFDETLRQCLVVVAPSTDKVDGAFSLSRHKYPSPFTIVI